MNHTFKQWTRSTAFNINLTGPAIADLLFQYAWERDLQARGIEDLAPYGEQFLARPPSTPAYLVRRGLISITSEGTYITTRAGRLMSEMLLEAGFELPEINGVFLQPKVKEFEVRI